MIEEQKRYINEKEVTIITGRATQTLRNDRSNRRGIPYVKLGRSIRYSIEDVLNFMESKKIKTDDL